MNDSAFGQKAEKCIDRNQAAVDRYRFKAAILLMFDKSFNDLPRDLVEMSNPMLVANESQEKLDGCVVEFQSIWPAVFTVQL